MFYLTTHSTHFIYGYMASDIWLRTILIVRKETRCRHIGYSYRLTARVLLYAPSHRQDNTYHGLCYTSRGALAGMRNSSMGRSIYGKITILIFCLLTACFEDTHTSTHTHTHTRTHTGVSKTLGGPWTRHNEGPQTNGLILVAPLHTHAPHTHTHTHTHTHVDIQTDR